MRLVLVLLAALALLTNPAIAAASQAYCLEQGGASAMADQEMAAMPCMPDMAPDPASGAADDPCCEHPTKPKPGLSCAQACAAACMIAALPCEPASLPLHRAAAPEEPGPMASLAPHQPGRLERPPRSI